MYAINEKLARLEQTGTPIRASLIGVGQMGQEILCQSILMKGFRIPVVVDLSVNRVL